MWKYKTHRRLELDRLIAYSLPGTAGTLVSPCVAREAVSISKTNRWEAEGCESFSDRPKSQRVWRNGISKAESTGNTTNFGERTTLL